MAHLVQVSDFEVQPKRRAQLYISLSRSQLRFRAVKLDGGGDTDADVGQSGGEDLRGLGLPARRERRGLRGAGLGRDRPQAGRHRQRLAQDERLR